MKHEQIEGIINRANEYKYSSLLYSDPEELMEAVVQLDTAESVFLYSKAEDAKELYWDSKSNTNLQLHWAAQSKDSFLSSLHEAIKYLRESEPSAEKLYLEFVPEEFIDDMNKIGFKVVSEWIDFWKPDLVNIEKSTDTYESKFSEKLNTVDSMTGGLHSAAIRPAIFEELHELGEITRRCTGLSRGFTGQNDNILSEWFETEHSKLFTYEIDGKPVGMCFVILYGFDSEQGTVVWIREVAVDPAFQSKGIGRALLLQGLDWGVKSGAKRSFLACDAENSNAIKLYESLGYARKVQRGQINMELSLGR